jgi:hypothetical protein
VKNCAPNTAFSETTIVKRQWSFAFVGQFTQIQAETPKKQSNFGVRLNAKQAFSA